MTNIIFLVIGIAVGFFIARAMKPTSPVAQVAPVQSSEMVNSVDTKVQTQLNNQVDNKKVIAAISAAVMYHNQG